jgi:hypothetical protein
LPSPPHLAVLDVIPEDLLAGIRLVSAGNFRSLRGVTARVGWWSTFSAGFPRLKTLRFTFGNPVLFKMQLAEGST